MKKSRFVGLTVVLLSTAFICIACGGSNQAQNTQESASGNNTGDNIDAEAYFDALLPADEFQYEKAGELTFPTDEEDQIASEVVPDTNPSETGTDFIPDSSAGIEIGELNKDNGYMEAVPVGATCSVDLNNDGRKDTITYNAVASDIAEYGTTVDSFVINDGEYRYTLYLSDQGIHIQKPALTSYYITDINTRDSYKEIAILDYGANGTPLTYFIRFVGGGTYCLGYVPYFPEDEHFVIKGDGTIESAYDLKLLQNWQAPAVWLSGSDQLLSSNLKMRVPDLYYPYTGQNEETVTLLKDIKLYANRDRKSATVDAKASDSAVTFTQTDNVHWVYVKQENGAEGWMYMENSETIVSGSSKYNRRDVFKNLL